MIRSMSLVRCTLAAWVSEGLIFPICTCMALRLQNYSLRSRKCVVLCAQAQDLPCSADHAATRTIIMWHDMDALLPCVATELRVH
jgi:hypothetical protein